MHYHLKLIIPKTDNVEETVASILAPFGDYDNDEEVIPFYDYYGIKAWGGEGEAITTLEEDQEENGTSYRVIITDKDFEPVFMTARQNWNGVNHQKSNWNGTTKRAVAQFKKHYSYKKENCPQGDWLVVNIDYHN